MKEKISPFLRISIANESMRASAFLKQCEVAAQKDDGVISKDEQEVLKKLKKAIQDYVKTLDKLYC